MDDRHSGWPSRLPVAFYDGLDELNRGEYFACHETLERLWLAEKGAVREVYQGVLQIAVGCYHLTARTNWIGATRKLDEGARRLERAGLGGDSTQCGVDWTGLIASADALQAHLREIGPANVTAFDRSLLPQASVTHAGRRT